MLDDNCTLCLPNGERIKLNPVTMRMLFEVEVRGEGGEGGESLSALASFLTSHPAFPHTFPPLPHPPGSLRRLPRHRLPLRHGLHRPGGARLEALHPGVRKRGQRDGGEEGGEEE